MTQPWEWNEDDIQALIANQVQESLTLDYKQSEALDRRKPTAKSDLSKDVSAFANSAGGTLIYGVEEAGHLPVRIDNGYDPQDITREWIEQVINSTIQRRIDNIRIKQITLDKANPGRVIYVVSIPQSKRAPHMAEDHRFYKRFNYQSVAMEEYEVRDIARRFEAPALYVRLNVREAEVPIFADHNRDQISKPITIDVSAGNESPTPAMYYFMTIHIDGRLGLHRHDGFENASLGRFFIEGRRGGERVPLNTIVKGHAIPNHYPLWRGQDFQFGAFSVVVPNTGRNDSYRLIWEISAPEMERRQSEYVLRVNYNRIQFFPIEDLSDEERASLRWQDDPRLE